MPVNLECFAGLQLKAPSGSYPPIFSTTKAHTRLSLNQKNYSRQATFPSLLSWRQLKFWSCLFGLWSGSKPLLKKWYKTPRLVIGVSGVITMLRLTPPSVSLLFMFIPITHLSTFYLHMKSPDSRWLSSLPVPFSPPWTDYIMIADSFIQILMSGAGNSWIICGHSGSQNPLYMCVLPSLFASGQVGLVFEMTAHCFSIYCVSKVRCYRQYSQATVTHPGIYLHSIVSLRNYNYVKRQTL